MARRKSSQNPHPTPKRSTKPRNPLKSPRTPSTPAQRESRPTQATSTPNSQPISSQQSVPIPWSQTQSQPMGSQQSGPNASQHSPIGTQTQPEDSPEKDKTKNLVWTAGMERSALEMYVKAVESGKRGEAGFKPEVHQTVATELATEFPGVEFTVPKVKSKFNQTFKKIWDAFAACKGASGFGWNEAECMVTASEEVWNAFLVSHPNARRFKNTPFPEYRDYQVIFEGNTATGVLRRSGATVPTEDAEGGPAAPGVDENAAENLDARQTPAQRPGVRAACCHRITSGDRFENSIDRLVDAFNQEEVSSIHAAIEKFQDHFATGLSMEELVTGFSVLENEAKAKAFLAIQDHDHAWGWMSAQINAKLPLGN